MRLNNNQGQTPEGVASHPTCPAVERCRRRRAYLPTARTEIPVNGEPPPPRAWKAKLARA